MAHTRFVRATLLSLLIVAANTTCAVHGQNQSTSQVCATRVVFDSEKHGVFEVYVLDLISGDVIQLTTYQALRAASRFPDFAPDGQHIVFVSESEQQTGQIFVIGANGEGLRQLTTDEAT
jgi:Tol biopolymer transport system component